MNKFTLIATLMLPLSSFAEPIQLDYGAFYSHVKKLAKENTSELQFAFGFKHVASGQLCRIQAAKIITEKRDIPLTVTAENRFTVPTERALKLAHAVVYAEVSEAANQCDMSVQLETKPEHLKSELSAQALRNLLAQYEAFFDNMGSFLSFMMPGVEGLRLQLADGTSTDASLNFDRGAAILTKEWIEDNQDALVFNQAPVRITAYTR